MASTITWGLIVSRETPSGSMSSGIIPASQADWTSWGEDRYLAVTPSTAFSFWKMASQKETSLLTQRGCEISVITTLRCERKSRWATPLAISPAPLIITRRLMRVIFVSTCLSCTKRAARKAADLTLPVQSAMPHLDDCLALDGFSGQHAGEDEVEDSGLGIKD